MRDAEYGNLTPEEADIEKIYIFFFFVYPLDFIFASLHYMSFSSVKHNTLIY